MSQSHLHLLFNIEERLRLPCTHNLPFPDKTCFVPIVEKYSGSLYYPAFQFRTLEGAANTGFCFPNWSLPGQNTGGDNKSFDNYPIQYNLWRSVGVNSGRCTAPLPGPWKMPTWNLSLAWDVVGTMRSKGLTCSSNIEHSIGAFL